ncbi:MAG: transporter substrate-binding domain-containing protein, partial [Methylococcales bacterium]
MPANILVFCVLLLFYSSPLPAASEQVSIQLKWQHSFQFAGYYAAIEKGYYRDAELDVRLKEINFSKDNVEQVIAGESEYGVSDSTLVIYHLKGKPVVLLKQFFQHSPLVFLSRRESGIVSPYEMVGKSVVFNNNNKGDASLNTLLFNMMGDLSKINMVEYDSSYFQQFIDGKIDVIFAYSTSEPYLLKEQGIDVNIINPQNYGIDFYGDNFFTSQKELSEHPERVAKMSQATVKGWQYALDHPDEIIQLIRDKYNPSLSTGYLQYAADTTRQMMIPGMIELGSINPKRYQRTGEEYLRLGFTETSKIEKEFYYGPSVPYLAQVKLTAKEQAWLKAHPLIRLGSESNWPPFEFVDKSGQLQGLSADVIRLVEQKLGIQFNVIAQYGWAETLEKVKSHDIDIISSIVKTPSREKYLSFTEAYIAPPTAIFIRKDSAAVSSLEDLKKKTVAVENQYYTHQRLADEYPDIKLLLVDTTTDALKALAYGKVDAYVGNQGVANWVAEQNVLTNLKIAHGAGLGEAPLTLAVRKDWPIFQGILDKAMASISKAEILAINRKWLGINSGARKLTLSTAEQKWLDEHKTIRFAGDPNWLPYEAFDKHGNYIGIVAEHLKLIEQKLGIKVNIIYSDTWSDSVAKVKRGEIDVLSETSDSDLKSQLTFTQAYVSSPVIIVMKNDEDYVENIDQIKQRKIAIIKEYGYVPEIIKKYPDLGLHRVDTIHDGLTAVSTGKVDALIATLAQASYHISELGINNIRIVGKTEFKTKLAFGMRKEFAPLVPLFDRALGSIKPGKKQRILDAWGKHKFATKIDYGL